MTMDNIQKSVASGIANSGSTITRSSLNPRAPVYIHTATSTQSNTPDSASGTGASPSTSDLDSLDSSLPKLEAALKATKISPRSCLKSARVSPGPHGNAAPTKRAVFASDDALLNCLVTGARTLPKTQTRERHEQFISRSLEMHKQRKAGHQGSNSHDDDDNDNASKASLASYEDNSDDGESESAEDKIVQQNLYNAELACHSLNRRAMASGAFDFALCVVHNVDTLGHLEDKAQFYRDSAMVGSYRGDERRHAYGRGGSLTILHPDMYEDFATAMSRFRVPAQLLDMSATYYDY